MKKWNFPLTDSAGFCSRKEYLDHLLKEIKEFMRKIEDERKALIGDKKRKK